MNGSGLWHADQAWLGHRAENVLIEVDDGRIKTITQDVPAPDGAVRLEGWTIPGLANVHSHAFQSSLRGATESGGGDQRFTQAIAKSVQVMELSDGGDPRFEHLAKHES